MSLLYTETKNNGISLETTENNIVNLFMLYERYISNEILDEYLWKAWNENSLKTIAIIYNSRDRINGKKEKNCSNRGMIWLRKNHFDIYKLNIKTYVEKYGCWKDILYISNLLNDTNYELKMIANQLIDDKKNYLENKPISLCSKWAPSENDKYKNKNLGLKIATYIFNNDKKKMEKYRKEILTPLRKKLNLIEIYMCSKKWDEIDYNNVCANSMKKYKNAFIKNDKEKYENYLKSIYNGEKKIKTTGILPHELVKNYLKNSNSLYDETIELQWKELINNVKLSGLLNNTIPIVDVSGSMYSGNDKYVSPLEVSISLGLLISSCTTGYFKNKIITFSEKPEIIDIEGDTLYEKVKNISKINSGYNTNFEAVFDLIINSSKLYNLDNNSIPNKVICLTDMQFDQASFKNIETVYETIKNNFKINNYNIPNFIFWNINSSEKTFPVNCKTENTAIISGFSEQLLKIFMKYNKFNPEIIVEEILEPYLKDIIIIEEVD